MEDVRTMTTPSRVYVLTASQVYAVVSKLMNAPQTHVSTVYVWTGLIHMYVIVLTVMLEKAVTRISTNACQTHSVVSEHAQMA